MEPSPLALVAIGVAVLLALILWLRVHALPALIAVSLGVALASGLEPAAALKAVTDGMGGTLGFIAVVVGLGAMFGALLEAGGGVQAISRGILAAFGEKRAAGALGLIGLIVATPVFFDVALIILAPVLFQLSRRTGRPAMLFAVPLLAGLAAGHAMVPPTPGPIAAANLLGAEIGWVAVFGLGAGLCAMLLGGIFWAWASNRMGLLVGIEPREPLEGNESTGTVDAASALLVIATPLLLIMAGTFSAANPTLPDGWRQMMGFVGHPFVALLVACALAYWRFGLIGKTPGSVLRRAMEKSLEPAGVVILVTGAGGAFKQVLVDTGAGKALAEAAGAAQLAPIVAAFLFAALVRVAQGSATVAMITAAGLSAPIAAAAKLGPIDLALVTIAIASGASVLSHVNDSGFWLVSRFLGLTEAQTLRIWTPLTTLVGLGGFGFALALFYALRL